MSEPAARGVTSERDVLLATKLNVPGLIPRLRLAQRLDEGLGLGLVLACAPAGCGKTALLAEWVRRGRHPVAWLSLDACDDDPARFWRHAVAFGSLGLCRRGHDVVNWPDYEFDVGGLAIAMDAAPRTDTGCWWPAPTHAKSVMPSAGKYRYRMTGG